MPVEVVGDDVRVVGSFDDWLMAVRPSRETDGESFLVNAFTSEVVHLPPLSPCHYSFLAESSSAFPILQQWLHRSAVLSASPRSGSKYTVAALSSSSSAKFLALWQPGMTSWYLCRRPRINTMANGLSFYQGKLYMVWKSRPRLFAFELREDEPGVSLSCPELYAIDPLIIPYNPTGWMRCKCNMVAWRGKLLLIIRFFCGSMYKPHSVEVFALDFSTSRPCGVTKIHNFDGDCIFVQKSGCRPFSAGLHVGVQGDLIYFSDGCIGDRFPFVFNMRDGTMRHLSASLLEGGIGFPIWIFPSS